MTLEEKRALLEAYDKLPQMGQRAASSKLRVHQSTLCWILQQRNEIKESAPNQDNCKRSQSGTFPEVDSAVIKWIRASHERGAVLSSAIVMTKATKFAKALGIEGDFHANDGWLTRLKKREGLVHKKLYGEGSSSDVESKEQWLEKVWPEISKNYSPESIWNCDETALYFRAVPHRTLTFTNDFSKGSKKSKDRVTALLGSSMIGEKKKVLIIGKSKKPCCFQGVSLPVGYAANKSAWMTGQIFFSVALGLG